MNVLIAGGSGFIGRALTEKLVQRGDVVSIISRSPEKHIPIDPLVTYQGWEINSLVNAVNAADVIVNLAGASIAGKNPLLMRWSKGRKSKIKNSRTQAGALISQAISLADRKPEVLIQSSAIGYYGNNGSGLVDETGAPGDDFLAEVCQNWENSTKSVEELGVRRVITRIGLVFSPSGGLLQLLTLPFRIYAGGRIGSGTQYLSWIHIDDLVNALIYFLENSQSQGVYNLCSPHSVKNQEFSKITAQILNKPSWLPVPGFLLRLILGEAATLALDGREVFPRRLLEAGYIFNYDHLSTALYNLFI